ncbi:MAG: WD40 repeat domain-containing protein [Spirochaetaceae bacterium]
MKKRILLALRMLSSAIVLLFFFGVSCATAEVAVQTSHVGSVRAIAYHAATASVVTGGSDGRIHVWDTEQERVVRSLQTGSTPIRALALHPNMPHAAVVGAAPGGGYRLQVWDVEERSRLFSQDLRTTPLVLSYSPSGEFLIVGESRGSGMTYLDSETGVSLPYPEVPQGIVTYATVGSSEQTLMTYLGADGSIQYWNLADAEIIGDARTEPNLAQMRVLENKRYAAAVDEDDLVVVDIVDGNLADRVELDGIEYLTVSRPGGRIVVLEDHEDGRRVSVWQFEGGALRRERIHEHSQLEEMNVVTLVGEELYGGSQDGELYLFRATNTGDEGRRLVRNVVEPIHDVALSDDTLYVNVGERIAAIHSDFFTPDGPRLEGVETVETEDIDNPADGPLRMSAVSDTEVILWGRDTDREDGSTLFLLRDGRVAAEHTMDSSVRDVIPFGDDSVLVVTRGDVLYQLSIPDFEQRLRYSALGMETAVGAEEFGVVVGKSRAGFLESSVLAIDPANLETVPLDTEAFLVFDLAYNGETGDLFALGISRNGSTRTIVTQFSGLADLMHPTTIYRTDGEYLDSSLALDPASGALYTSAGPSGITRIDGEENPLFGEEVHATQRLQSAGGIIWSVNRNGSVSLWDPETGERTGDLYFFEDEGWALLTAEGRYFASSEQAEAFMASVSGRRETRAFRLRLSE